MIGSTLTSTRSRRLVGKLDLWGDEWLHSDVLQRDLDVRAADRHLRLHFGGSGKARHQDFVHVATHVQDACGLPSTSTGAMPCV